MDKSFGNELSVVIRVKNEERWIGHTIQSVLDFFPGAEIIIVDNNSTDQTINICKLFSKPKIFSDNINSSYSNFIFTNISEYTPGKSLNKGIGLATRDNVLIISSHCVIKNIDYSILKKDLDDYVGIFGNQIPVYLGKKIQKRYIWSNFSDTERSENYFSNNENRYFFHNAFSIFKRKNIIGNLFDEEVIGKEDRYWAKDIINKELKYIYEPKHVVEHHFTPNGNTWRGLA